MSMKHRRVAIVGSRNFPVSQLPRIEKLIKHLPKDYTVVTGGASGVDEYAEAMAKKHNLSRDIFYADWQNHGKAAGFIRNKLILEKVDKCYIFWDGFSKGTRHDIDICMEKGIDYAVFFARKEQT